jgi:hypothetical protein
MANCGNFLEYAGTKCGLDVGYGKIILIYPEKTSVEVADLTASAINAAIVAGDIVGVIKGWNTVAGAPVAEVSIERTGTGEMKLIREEIKADTLTFENSLDNNEVLGDLTKAGSVYCLLIDDQGSVYGEKSVNDGFIDTALFNFSNKVTSSGQSDRTTEKTVAVTVRYLVKNLDVVLAEVATEDVATKQLLYGYLQTGATATSTAIMFKLMIKDRDTAKAFASAIAASDVTVSGADITSKTVAYVTTTGVLTINLVGVGFLTTGQVLNVSISGADFYMKSMKVVIVP